jgi:hypothetical protein
VLIGAVVWAGTVFGYDRFRGRTWRQLGRITRVAVVLIAIAVGSRWWIPLQARAIFVIGLALLFTGAWIDAKRDPPDTATLTPQPRPS